MENIPGPVNDNTPVEVPTVQIVDIKKRYSVKRIEPSRTRDWCMNKHYAKRLPSIMIAFGLYDHSVLIGICTFGMTPNYIEMKAWEPFDLLELNRLVVNDGLPANTTSFFVGHCLKKIPKPTVIISYADIQMGHFGYIYQATNWIYTGIGGIGSRIYIMKDGTERHQRHDDLIDMDQVDRIEKTTGKARYYYFCGHRKDRKKMMALLRFPVLPYPKGDPKRYDAGYVPAVQLNLF